MGYKLTWIYMRPNGAEHKIRPTWWQPWANTKVYYNINDNDTNSTIYDLSWNWVDQTWHWTPWYTTDATYGRVATFNGSSRTQAGSRVNLGNECTLIALVKTSSTNAQSIVLQWASSSARPFWLALNENVASINRWAFGIFSWTWDSDNSFVWATPYPLSTDVWTFIAATRASDWTAKIYINGVLNNTHVLSRTPSYSSWENLQIGRWRNWDTKYLNWDFKLFIWEDRTRTDQEIADLASEYGF